MIDPSVFEFLDRPPLEGVERDSAPRVVEESFVAFWASFAGGDEFHVRREAGLTLLTTSMPDHNLNRVLQAHLDPARVDAAIERAIGLFGEMDVPFSWVVGPTPEPSDLPDRLLVRGFVDGGAMRAMVGNLDALPDDVPPAELVVEEADEPEARNRWLRLWVEGIPDWAVENWLRLHGETAAGQDRMLRRYLGSVDGEPVATSALVLGAGVAGLQAVGTAPAFRGRGIGTAMTLAPFKAARQLGYRVGALISTDSGYSLYRRLGFWECGSFRFFV